VALWVWGLSENGFRAQQGDGLTKRVEGSCQFGFDLCAKFCRHGSFGVTPSTGPIQVAHHGAAEPEGPSIVALITGQGPPSQGPAAHGGFELVAAAAADEEGEAGLAKVSGDFHDDVVGHLKMGEGVAGEDVHA